MAEIKVKFLGNDYLFPEELKQYIGYCNEFEKISDRLSQALLSTMKNTIDNLHVQLENIETPLKEKMRAEGKNVISMFAKNNIFDITESDLIDENKGYLYCNEVFKEMMDGLVKNLQDELESFIEGYESVQRSAYSQITGTGISMYSNSIIAHMTLAAFETSTLKKQCEKADRDFEIAFDSMIARNTSIRESKDIEVMIKAFTGIAEAFGIFVSELMEKYLNKLEENSIFEYSKVKPYNIKRSTDLLNNLSIVDDKKSVIEQAFKSCPYNPDIYAKVLELGLCDVDTFITAKEFYQDSLLVGVIEEYCKNNMKNLSKIRKPITVLALYKEKKELDILDSFYKNELDSVKNQYRILSTILTNKTELDKWIRKNLGQYTYEVTGTSIDEIRSKIHSIVFNIITNTSYYEFVNLGLMSAESIRIQDSSAVELEKINIEYENKIMNCVNDYVKEAKHRKQRYDIAYDKFNVELKKRQNAISEKYRELSSIGVFALSKKKELKSIISTMEKELSQYKADNEPKDLQIAFEKMYS